MKLLSLLFSCLTANAHAPIEKAEEIEKTAESAAEMFFEPGRFLDMLSYMGIGMFVIFVLIGVIIMVTILTNKIFSGRQ